jgi:hypothetical protein
MISPTSAAHQMFNAHPEHSLHHLPAPDEGRGLGSECAMGMLQ